ncbi:signal transduction histidine kinase sensor [Moraxella macacae 0408225]|uniref:Sensor protein n=1 Tax=Moraxella macacae 0408225 TaxID=1230338 RepID=L2F958_9GAMM|nr:histidine kinase [Moraxella macacae]ELA09450.1 signal transduction histidine kinase sensor [Moraxella macacae 0408225]
MIKLPTFIRQYMNSLPIRASGAVAIIAFLMIISAMIGGFLAWTAERDAQAVNTAGSMHMATYRINFMLANDYQYIAKLDKSLAYDVALLPSEQLIHDMQQKLAKLQDYENSYNNSNPKILAQLAIIDNIWQTQLLNELKNNDKANFYKNSVAYINHVDKLVSLIQERNENRQNLQQFFQIVMSIVSIVVMMVGLYELHHNVLLPIRQIGRATKQLKTGKPAKVALTAYDELNELGRVFNEMSQTIYHHQEHLQSEVARKTYHLSRSNQALALLFEFAKQINTQTISFAKLQQLIDEVSGLLPNVDLTLCLNSQMTEQKDSFALHNKKQGSFCQPDDCNRCEIRQEDRLSAYLITHQNIEFGELLAQVRTDEMVHSTMSYRLTNPNQIPVLTLNDNVDSTMLFSHDELLKTLASLIGMALAEQKLRQQEHQIVLLEERNIIGRELHDSLAQSLTYLKFELSGLTKLLGNQYTSPMVNEKINHLKDGLNGAYVQLRELLQTFRLSIDTDFEAALQNACEEFGLKGGFGVKLDNRIMAMNLSANEQIDVIQIVREALSNAHKHAKAFKVLVSLSQDSDGNVVLEISDDGIGIDFNFNPQHHHGLKIMNERGKNLGGSVEIRRLQQGTQVRLSFMPRLFVV